MSDWLTFWLTDWVTDWSDDWLTDWLAADMLPTYWLTWLAYQHTGQLTGWLAQLLTGCFTKTDWLTVAYGSTDHGCWLIDWLTWLADRYTEIHAKKRIKIIDCESRLLIANEDGQFFISDWMWPADVLRLQQPGFWTYLQYCKCCIHCFVIKLYFSES